ncbi:MAG: hypothetical protein ACTSP0_06420 [Alphaproteobacteria bacterium]
MQVLTNTHEKLVLKVRYTFLAGASWFSAVMLVYGMINKWAELDEASKWGMGATCLAFTAVTIYFLRPSVFEFDRAANQFRWTKPGLFKSHHGETSLDRIERVRVDADYVDDSKGYRVLVETRGGKISFQHCYTTSAASDHQQIVDLIRAWLSR